MNLWIGIDVVDDVDDVSKVILSIQNVVENWCVSHVY
jgi:hypothetical protein